jgi:hypothetical protein
MSVQMIELEEVMMNVSDEALEATLGGAQMSYNTDGGCTEAFC